MNTQLSSLGAEATGRTALLAAASTLMAETGSIEVSLHQIARRAKVTAPLVKYHFGSRNGLLVALAQRDTANSLLQLESLLAMNIDPASKLRSHIIGIVQTYARYPYLNTLLDKLLSDEAADPTQVMQVNFMRPLIEAQRSILEEGIEAGQFRQIDPTMAYFLIVGSCQYIFSTRMSFRELTGRRRVDDAAARRYGAFAADVILRGLLRT